MNNMSGMIVSLQVLLLIAGFPSWIIAAATRGGGGGSGNGARDLSLNQYSEQGECRQLMYAGRAVERSLPLLGVSLLDRNTTLLLRASRPSPLSADTQSTFTRIDRFMLAASGYLPDCRAALQQASIIIQSHKLQYGESPPMELLAGELSRWLTRGLHREDRENAVARPFACSVLICGLDDRYKGCIRLVQHTGAHGDSDSHGLGSHAGAIMQQKIAAADVLEGTSALTSSERRVERLVNGLLKLEEGVIEIDMCVIQYTAATAPVPENEGSVASVRLLRGIKTTEDVIRLMNI